MARGPQKTPDPNKPGPPGMRAALEEAWHGWLKPVGLIVLLIGSYFAYDRGLISETKAGLLVVALIVGGTIVALGFPILETMEKRQHKILFGTFLAAWALGAGYPPLKRAFPAAVIGEPVHVAFCGRYKDAERHDCADPKLTASVTLPDGGPYDVEIGGELKGTGEAESKYHLTIAGDGGSSEEVEGTLTRTFFHQRTSRRGAGGTMVKQERTENAHRLSVVKGPNLKITADGLDEDYLESGLTLTFHKTGPDPRLFLLLAALCVLLGAWIDFQLSVPKVKTYLATGAGLTLVFAWYFPQEATPHFLVRPAVAALIASSLGALGGWLLSAIAKSFKPKPKKIVK